MRRHQRPTEEYIECIHHASKLVRVLLFCATGDNLAHCYLQTFAPYAVFFELAEDPDLSEVSRQMSGHSPRMDVRSGGSRVAASKAARAAPFLSYSSGHSNSGATSSGASTSYSTPASGEVVSGSAELSASELDALAMHLLDILQSPFGGEGRVERCPHLDMEPPMTTTEDNHARFWNSRGFKVPAWDRDEPRSLAVASLTQLPLESALYGEGCRGVPPPRMHTAAAAKERRADDLDEFFRRTT